MAAPFFSSFLPPCRCNHAKTDTECDAHSWITPLLPYTRNKQDPSIFLLHDPKFHLIFCSQQTKHLMRPLNSRSVQICSRHPDFIGIFALNPRNAQLGAANRIQIKCVPLVLKLCSWHLGCKLSNLTHSGQLFVPGSRIIRVRLVLPM